jgi:hypothetical protein
VLSWDHPGGGALMLVLIGVIVLGAFLFLLWDRFGPRRTGGPPGGS